MKGVGHFVAWRWSFRLGVCLLILGSVCEAFAPPLSYPPLQRCRALARRREGLVRKAFLVACAKGTQESGQNAGQLPHAKLEHARKLLEDSRSAFAASQRTHAKAEGFGAAWGLNSTASAGRDLYGELRIQAQWSRAGRALYGTWIQVFGSAADFSNDPLGLKESWQQRGDEESWIESVFERLDVDKSGAIDSGELESVVLEMTGKKPDEGTVKKLLSEATLRNPEWTSDAEVVISRRDFSGPMKALLDQRRALGLASELAKAAERERDEVVTALDQAQSQGLLVGGSRNASLRLDELRTQGLLQVWNTGQVVKETVTAKRIQTEMNFTGGPDTALGLRPSAITRFRYSGIRWVGLLGALALLVSSCVPSALLAVSRITALVGMVCSAMYLCCMVFAKQVDKVLLYLQLEANEEGKKRWARREAGKLLAAYVHGVPVAALAQPLPGFHDVAVYTRHSGDFCVLELSKGLTPERFGQVALSSTEAHKQACIQMTGLVAEWMHYGAASEGFRYVSTLERHLMLSQEMLSPVDRQALARWGVLQGFRMLKLHARGYEAMVRVLTDTAPGEKLELAPVFSALEVEHRKSASAKAITGGMSGALERYSLSEPER